MKLNKTMIALLTGAAMCGCVSAIAKESLYSQGQSYLDDKNWSAAEEAFSKAVKQGSGKADAALYWLAYSQHKSSQNHKALKTIERLHEAYPESQWIDDSVALEAEINDRLGNSEEISEDELKLYAINSLMSSSAEKAYTILEKLLKADHSPRVKKRAMFVLSQTNSEKSLALISKYAQTEKNPELQLYAVETLGIAGTPKALAQLQRIYQSTQSNEVKAKVISSLMVGNDVKTLLDIAKKETDKDLKGKAINMVGVMNQPDALFEMYRDKSFSEFKDKIVRALAMSGGVKQLGQIIENEKNKAIKLSAINQLGIISSKASSEYLAKTYRASTDIEVKAKVIHALFIQSNAKALIKIAKTEKDNQLKRKAIKYLSMIDSDEVTDFFGTILE